MYAILMVTKSGQRPHTDCYGVVSVCENIAEARRFKKYLLDHGHADECHIRRVNVLNYSWHGYVLPDA